MKSIYKLVLVLLLALLLVACGGKEVVEQPKDVVVDETADVVVDEVVQEVVVKDPMEYLNAAREDTVILMWPYAPENLVNWNPYTPGNANDWGGNQVLYESLFILNYETGEYMPWMAESMTGSDDLMTWELKLRDGVEWADGTPFTVDDIIFSYDIQVATETLGSHFTFLEWIESVEKVDDLNMVFNLKKPNPRFQLDFYSVKIYGAQKFIPKHIWETLEDPLTFSNFDIDNGLPMGTGAYVLAKITPNEVLYVRNDNWWGAKTGFQKLPEPQLVIFSYVGTEEVASATAIDNGFDSLQDITFGAWQAIQAQNPNWEAWYPDFPFAVPDPCARLIGINNAIEPWNDRDMRWVLNYVMDRQQIVDIAYEGTTSLAPYFWPSYASMQPFSDLIPQDALAAMLKPDLEKATEIMLAKGYVKDGDYWTKDGKALTLEIQTHEAYSELERNADVFAEQLQRFGINAVKVKLQGGTFFDNNAFGNFEANSQWFTCGSVNEPWASLRTMAGEAAPIGERPEGLQNAYRWYNERYTEVVQRIGELPLDDPEVLTLTAEALAILYDELPALPAAQAKKLIPNNNTYWTNWPTQANPYISPWNWWTSFQVVLVNIEKAD